MKTAQEIAQLLNIPQSTARLYISRYPEFFNRKRVSGARWEKLTDDAVRVLQDIVSLSRSGMGYDEVHTILRERFPVYQVPLSQAPAYDTTLTTSPAPTSLDIVSNQNLALFQAVNEQQKALSSLVDKLVGVIENQNKLLAGLAHEKETAGGRKRGKTRQSRARRNIAPSRGITRAHNSHRRGATGTKQNPRGMFARLFFGK